MAAAPVYVKELERLGHGYPLYKPDVPIDVGDVGFLQHDSGRFRRLFNVLLEAAHPAHARDGVPHGFVPLSPDKVRFETDDIPAGPISSKSVVAIDVEVEVSPDLLIPVGLGMSFKCSNAVGATLLVRERATCVDIVDNNHVHQYIAQHINSWYDHANTLGYGPTQAPEGSIMLIKGCAKTSSWAHATFTERTREASIFFNGGFVMGGVATRLRGSWARAVSAVSKDGPHNEPSEHALLLNKPAAVSSAHFPPGKNSCLFTRVYRCKQRPGFGPIKRTVGIRVGDKSSSKKLSDMRNSGHRADPPKASSSNELRATSGSSAPSGSTTEIIGIDSPGHEKLVDITINPDIQLEGHILDSVLDYILERDSSCLLAVTTDDDLKNICKNTKIPEDIPLFLRSLAPTCVSLAPRTASLRSEPSAMTSRAAGLQPDARAYKSHTSIAKSSKDALSLVSNGAPVTLQDLLAYTDAARHLKAGGLDDRQLLFEDLIRFMSRLHTMPHGRAIAASVEKTVIDILYKDLPHPPSEYLSTPNLYRSSHPTMIPSGKAEASPPARLKYASRSDDGSDYNPLFPSMGKAGEPYARSVPSLHYTPSQNLPDPGLVFDTLLKRDKFIPHPSGISSLFFAFANVIIHTAFNTNYADETINDASSYLDLQPLYGGGPSHFVKPVSDMRTFDGTGKIWPDTFADGRLMFIPPSTGAVLILFNRNHNYICDKLLHINENKTFKNPPPTDKTEKEKQDDELFARARLVNCGFFMQVILQDYVGSILGLEQAGLTWRLDPLEDSRQDDHVLSPRGEGNVASIEFNLLYRWHAASSEPDGKWTADEFKKMLPGKKYDEVSAADYKNGVRTYLAPRIQEDVKKWQIGGMERVDGVFRDDDLAKILQDATMAPACAFKARGSPEWMRVIEILGIEQSRKWGTCTLNEFRKFVGLRPYESFKDWNPDADIWMQAEALYTDIDNLELYVGIQAEEAKAATLGSGLCPGYTISRAILGDAVALTRGDPYLTTAMTPYNFTNWGWQDCQPDVQDGALGGMLTRLLLRFLPQHYGSRSALALFPFQVPGTLKTDFAKLPNNPAPQYNWDRLKAPIPLQIVKTFDAVEQILLHPEIFGPISQGCDALLSAKVETAPVQEVFSSPVHVTRWNNSVFGIIKQLTEEMTILHPGSKPVKYLDVVQVLNILPCYLISDEIAGLPLKTDANPQGVFQPLELAKMFADIANYSYMNLDLTNEWSLRERATKAVKDLLPTLEHHFKSIEDGSVSVASAVDTTLQYFINSNDKGFHLRREIYNLRGNQKPEELAKAVIKEIIASAAIWSATIASVVDFFLDATRTEQLAAFLRLSDNENALGYIHEAIRFNPPFTAMLRRANHATTVGSLQVTQETDILLSLLDANADERFGDADAFNPSREAPLFNVCRRGFMSSEFFSKSAPTAVRSLLSLPNIRRAPNASGYINRFKQDLHGVPQVAYLDNHGKISPFPTSLNVQYSV